MTPRTFSELSKGERGVKIGKIILKEKLQKIVEGELVGRSKGTHAY